jgi:hypothetical protein
MNGPRTGVVSKMRGVVDCPIGPLGSAGVLGVWVFGAVDGALGRCGLPRVVVRPGGVGHALIMRAYGAVSAEPAPRAWLALARACLGGTRRSPGFLEPS